MTDNANRNLDESISVVPDEGKDGRQDAGRDRSIARRLEKNPESSDARLDNALDESMDASDPPAATQPAKNTDAPASSGFDEEAERLLREERDA